MKSLRILALVALASFGFSAAQATVVWHNGGPDGAGGVENFGSDVFVDDFRFARTTILTDAHFWAIEGGEWSGALFYAVWADTGSGAPGTLLDVNIGTNIQRTATGAFPFGLPEYEYSFDLPAPLVLGPGTYWITFFLDSVGIFWETTAYQQGGTALRGPATLGGPWTSAGDFDLAFYLTGIPAPAGVWLFGLGLLAMAGANRRRSKGA